MTPRAYALAIAAGLGLADASIVTLALIAALLAGVGLVVVRSTVAAFSLQGLVLWPPVALLHTLLR